MRHPVINDTMYPCVYAKLDVIRERKVHVQCRITNVRFVSGRRMVQILRPLFRHTPVQYNPSRDFSYFGRQPIVGDRRAHLFIMLHMYIKEIKVKCDEQFLIIFQCKLVDGENSEKQAKNCVSTQGS